MRFSGSSNRGMARYSLIDLTNLLMAGFLLVFYFLALPRIPNPLQAPAWYLILVLLVESSVRVRERYDGRRLAPPLIFLLTVLFLFVAFESIALTLPHFNPRRYDWLMAAADHTLFGLHPTVWLEGFSSPVLTEALYILYAFYFPMPVILLGWMLARGRYRAVSDGVFRYLLCYYGAYVAYFLVPVQGPRFYLAHLQGDRLSGLFLSEPIRKLIDLLEPNKLDAFPSLHAAILLVTLMLAFRENRAMFRWFLGCGVGILVSLVYLRYHYVVDLIAGLVWAVAGWHLGGWIIRKCGAGLAPHFGEEG
ncbi:MAG: phosphatase PAP2 family protein [bacterium]|nr:phosphatase PAP2 family protein [bacterium]